MKTVLVIAFKYNDILYAINTEEWKEAKYRKLIVFYNDAVSLEDYPFQELFDMVVGFHYTHDSKSICSSLLKILRIRNKILADDLITSNPLLLIVRFIYNLSKTKDVLWIEDGLMNYDKPDSDLLSTGFIHSKIKQLVQYVLGVDEKKLVRNIRCTYLLLPEEAVYYYGSKKKLIISAGIYDSFSFLEGKKILIGQNLYPIFCAFDEYIHIVNDIMKRMEIDYYIPHLLSDVREYEEIEGQILNLSKQRVTLEMLASSYKFTIVSFGSSLLYTAKLINYNVKTIYVKLPFYDISSFPIIEKNVDEVLEK